MYNDWGLHRTIHHWGEAFAFPLRVIPYTIRSPLINNDISYVNRVSRKTHLRRNAENLRTAEIHRRMECWKNAGARSRSQPDKLLCLPVPRKISKPRFPHKTFLNSLNRSILPQSRYSYVYLFLYFRCCFDLWFSWRSSGCLTAWDIQTATPS